MSELHFSWLEMSILVPVIGALIVGRLRGSDAKRRWSVFFAGLTFIFTVGAWRDFQWLHVAQAEDQWHFLEQWFGRKVFIIDNLNAPLLPLIALLHVLTALATLRTKVQRFSFSWALISEAIMLATFTAKEPWVIIALMAASTIPPYRELRARNKPTRVYAIHMGLFIVMLAMGWAFVEIEGTNRVHSLWAIVPLLLAVLIRSGINPLHCWMTELFEHATFGTALLFVVPIPGAYVATRLVLPIAPDWVLRSVGLLSLATAVYAASMSLIQKDGRRFFCYLFLSHSALVLVGLEVVTPIGLTGALCVWLSVGLALGGFGLTMRALESRVGRLSLADFQGLYSHTPALAMLFVLTGLASVGFPGTFGFIGTELLVDGAVEAYPLVGVAVVVAAALNGIAIVQMFFRLFTGTQYFSTVSLRLRKRERFAVLLLALLILGGGLAPQPGVASRHHAAHELLDQRHELQEASRRHDENERKLTLRRRQPATGEQRLD
ncbi:MAG: oxidoreductase [Planctomycetales bacterium]|nr:oxidoreductase [Planctomycetales bacterium]